MCFNSDYSKDIKFNYNIFLNMRMFVQIEKKKKKIDTGHAQYNKLPISIEYDKMT